MMRDIENVRVAIRIRPQSVHERGENVPLCLTVRTGKPQLTIGRNKTFTFDYVFDQQTSQETVYEKCVEQLVEGSFDGYNATVFAYGQTGSGKTYTMGTSFEADQQTNTAGIIPRAVAQLFNGINERRETAQKAGKVVPSFEISVQFIEIYNEKLIDLLSSKRHSSASIITIHEDPVRHEIYLRGVSLQNVTSPEAILAVLKAGARRRSTAATNSNQQSSRSHAIFTVNIKQSRDLKTLHAKFHFVDLAGSERLNKTSAAGDRAREGISINSGLLALGNVISALGGSNGRRVGHVPYRDSKLTRLLQDSLGGNSRTLMIACISPNEPDQAETLNSLNYANRAKDIKNEVVANQNKSSKLITELQHRIQIIEAELLEWQTGKKRRRSETSRMEQLADATHKLLENEAERDNILKQHATPKKVKKWSFKEANNDVIDNGGHLMAHELPKERDVRKEEKESTDDEEEESTDEEEGRKYEEEEEMMDEEEETKLEEEEESTDEEEEEEELMGKHLRSHIVERPLKKLVTLELKPQRESTKNRHEMILNQFLLLLKNSEHKVIDHQRAHTDERPLKCTICGHRSSQAGNLKRRMRTHTGVKSFKCAICAHQFSKSGTLKRHMRTHTGEKPFKCTICGLRSAQSWNLKQHMLTHSGVKPFKCTKCTYRSARAADLKRHMRTHTGCTMRLSISTR